MPTPEAEPPEPTPRQMLVAAELIAAGVSQLRAGLRVGLSVPALLRMRDGEEFKAVLAECRQAREQPAAERDALLGRLIRLAAEQALADGRVGAIPAAMRLLDPPPPRSPGGGGLLPPPGTPARRRDPDTAGDAEGGAGGSGDDEEEPDPFRDAAEALWGIRPGDAGGWLGADGRPVLPGHRVQVLDAPGGPVRMVDACPTAANEAFAAMLDGMDEAQTLSFNRAAYPFGGPQWNPRNRTLWWWDGRDRDRPRPGPARLLPAPAEAPEPDSPDSREDAPATPTSLVGPPIPAAPATLETSQADATSEADAATPAADAPPPPPSAPSPLERLRARLARLLANGTPADPDEADLAEAVCARLWPNWPPYAGPIDPYALDLLLAATPPDPRQLARLGGCEGGGAGGPKAARAPPG